MNYISISMIEYANALREMMRRHHEANPEGPSVPLCTWRPNTDSRPCSKPADYFVPDDIRVASNDTLELTPQWYCHQHMEAALGHTPHEQPFFARVEEW